MSTRRGGSSGSPTVSVLIPTYRDAHLVRRSLPVYLDGPPQEVEIVVLNNDPAQDVRAALAGWADDPRVRLVEMGWEAGFARAVNREDLKRGAEELGLPLEEHAANVINFLRLEAEPLGLKGNL